MVWFWIVLATVNLLLLFGTIIVCANWSRHAVSLHDVSADAIEKWPLVSIVVAARNEQRDIEVALRSLLSLDYCNLEIIVVDDRSTDDTGKILDRLAEGNSRLLIQHVVDLPSGWIGKNHALYSGARVARGDLLLFTDADVVMEVTTLRRAVTYLLENNLDHPALAPRIDVPSRMLQAFVVLFLNLFVLYIRPWRISDPNSSAHVGIGAFNLVRKTAYQEVGTHRTIALRPDDDLKLGKIIKQQGFRQDIVDGIELVRVPWYASVAELVSGMEKNAFSGVEYSVFAVIGISVLLLVFMIWPFVAVVILSGLPRFFYIIVIALLWTQAWLAARSARMPWQAVVLCPLAALLLIWIQWRAMCLTYVRGGIVWRDTLYPLSELRKNRV